ncbi:MAG: hypothetical protein JXQ87_08165 [Bacteroidia bacterium]
MTKPVSITFNELNNLSTMVRPALLTFTRGKNIAEQGIDLTGNFPNVFIEPKKLEAYRNYFGFRNQLPITYLYLLAQRAKAALMLNKAYTLSIPGTIHLNTNIEILKEIDPLQRLAIETTIKVPYKAQGALAPVFEITFLQDDGIVAKGDGSYLIKRKSKKKSKPKQMPQALANASVELEWQLSKKDALEYANLSNDHNPIHTNLLAARLLGFKSQIMHGWYVASRCAQHVEQQKRREINRLNIEFLGAHTLPGSYLFKNNANLFQTIDEKQNKVLSQGSFNFL